MPDTSLLTNSTNSKTKLAYAIKAWVTSHKAANYSAHAGETIAGNLVRGGNGQFSSGGDSSNTVSEGKLTPATPTSSANAPKDNPPSTSSNTAPTAASQPATNALTTSQQHERQALQDKHSQQRLALQQQYQADIKRLGHSRELAQQYQALHLSLLTQQRQELRAQADQQRAARLQAAQDKKQSKVAQQLRNINTLASKYLGDGLTKALFSGGTPGDLTGIDPKDAQALMQKGLAVRYPDGSYDLSPTGRSMLVAMRQGNEKKANQAIMRASQAANRQQASAATRPAKAPSLPKKHKEVAANATLYQTILARAKYLLPPPVVTSHKETVPQGSFTAFKDVNGQWRWVARSSSNFQDRDGEFVSAKALDDAVARQPIQPQKYGKLDWWHTPIKLGQGDFSATHNGMLIESGTFVNDGVALAVKSAIDKGLFAPGVSLTFEHNEPGPQVVPGRVFNQINIIGRSLLPAEKASNLASTFSVVNSVSNGNTTNSEKEVTRKMLEQKIKELEALLGPELMQGVLNGSETARKELAKAGVAYKEQAVKEQMITVPASVLDAFIAEHTASKAAAALDTPMAKSVMSGGPALPGAKKKPATTDMAMKADAPATLPTDGGADDLMGLGGDEEAGEDETPEDEAFEASPTDQNADAIMEGLFNSIGKMVNDNMQKFVSQIQEAIAGVGATSEKEVSILANMAAVMDSIAGDHTASKAVIQQLEGRLAALEGTQPRIVNQRASQTNGMSAMELPPHLAGLVASKEADQDKDPYVAMAGNMVKGMGIWGDAK